MCGICGLYAPGSIDRGVLQRMNDTIVHRGPDDEGFYTDERVGLASRRLAIIDLTSGRMPIHNEDESVWVVQNGEIYNFRAIRAELEAKGHRFTTHTDTEVLVHLYEEAGDAMFERLRGMFAIALWDRKRDILLLGRDRVGKKPLYYAWDGKNLAFGSEIKALRQVPGLQLSLDWEALEHYFGYLYIPDPLCIFREIRKLPAGHFLKLERGRVDVRPYWDLRFDEPFRETDERFYIENLRELLTDAVRCRLVSDVPLGAFLSGGVDSATVVGLMSQLIDEPVKTFSIGFEEESHDELHFARLAAKTFHTDHHEEILRPNAAELLAKLVYHFDEPFGDPSALPTFMVSQMARRHVTVVLSGDGGDEAFAGYDSHAVHERDERFHRRVPHPVRSLAAAGLGAAARLTGHRKLTRVAGAVRRANRPLAGRFYKIFDAEQRQRLFAPETRRHLAGANVERVFAAYMDSQPFPDFLSRVLYADTKSYMTSDILVKVDRASMACSLEVRAPLVDHPLLEFVARIPSEFKRRNGVSKYILKRTVESFVPHEIVYRKKQGFGVPIEKWFMHELRDMLHDEILARDDGGEQFFDRAFVERMLREHMAGAHDWSAHLYPLLVFRLWWRRWKP